LYILHPFGIDHEHHLIEIATVDDQVLAEVAVEYINESWPPIYTSFSSLQALHITVTLTKH
jgi:hypothetical protein